MTGNAHRLGSEGTAAVFLTCWGYFYGALRFYGFGAAAHILCQVAKHQGINLAMWGHDRFDVSVGREVYAFVRARRSDGRKMEFAQELGVVWAGDATEMPPKPLDAAIIFVCTQRPHTTNRQRTAGKFSSATQQEIRS